MAATWIFREEKSRRRRGRDLRESFGVAIAQVADPRVVKFNLEDGGVDVDRVVTLVDAPAFAEQWMSYDAMEDRIVDEDPHLRRAIFRRRVAAPPRPRRGHSVGDAAAAR